MSDAAPSLPTTLAECHALITKMAAINAQQQVAIDEQQTLLQSMQRDLALMKRTLFGQRRERFEDPLQGMLFDSAVVGQPDEASNPDDTDADTSIEDETLSSGAGRGRRVIPAALPRVQRIHKLDDAEIPEHL